MLSLDKILDYQCQLKIRSLELEISKRATLSKDAQDSNEEESNRIRESLSILHHIIKCSHYRGLEYLIGNLEDVVINITDMVMVYVYLSSDGNGDNYWQSLPYNEYINN